MSEHATAPAASDPMTWGRFSAWRSGSRGSGTRAVPGALRRRDRAASRVVGAGGFVALGGARAESGQQGEKHDREQRPGCASSGCTGTVSTGPACGGLLLVRHRAVPLGRAACCGYIRKVRSMDDQCVIRTDICPIHARSRPGPAPARPCAGRTSFTAVPPPDASPRQNASDSPSNASGPLKHAAYRNH
jgi:hypothetical protein